jgi:hypothetical protein
MYETAMRKAGGDNLALTVLHVPSSLDSCEARNFEEEGEGRNRPPSWEHHRALGIVLL